MLHVIISCSIVYALTASRLNLSTLANTCSTQIRTVPSTASLKYGYQLCLHTASVYHAPPHF